MSGIQFSSPVTNQKASPAIHASSLATRPAPQLPGRIFVDTDNPSTGMYRDTGTVWVQLSSGSGTVPDLQTVCNVGFLTDTDMTFLYTNSADTSKIGFLNQAVGDFTFDIFKKASELFSIRALKPSSVDEEMEIIFDAPGNTIKTQYNNQNKGILLDFFNNEYIFADNTGANASRIEIIGFNINLVVTNNNFSLNFDDSNNRIDSKSNGSDKGISLDFQNQIYRLGENYGANGSINLDFINNEIGIYDSSIYIGNIGGNNTRISLLDGARTIATISQGDDIGLKLDFQNTQYYIGDFNFVNNQTYFYINDNNQFAEVAAQNWRFKFDGGNQVFKTSDYLGNDTGLKLDFTTNQFYLGSTTEYIGIDTTNNTLIAGANLTSASSGGNSGQHLKININGTNYKIELKNP